MIENLTPISFALYGTIVNDGLQSAMRNTGFTFIKQREIREKQIKGVYVNNNNSTILDICDGTAVLYVGTSPDNLKMFLLDKTVIIAKGIYFCIAPLLTKAIFSMSTNGNWPVFERIAPAARSIGIGSSININCIYTLLYHEKEKGFRFKGESHDIWELTYVTKGSIFSLSGNDERRLIELHEGDILLYAPGQWHEQYADKDVSACYMTLTFDMNFVGSNVFGNRVFHADKEMTELINKIMLEKEKEPIYDEDMIICYAKQLIILLIRRCEDTKPQFHESKIPAENDISEYVKDYIRSNVNKKLCVSDIAKSIPINASYLSTLFKRSTGITLVEYINKAKLEKAKEYIRDGKYSFTQISETLSFNSVHYFSKQFKKRFGITPSEYARRHKIFTNSNNKKDD